MDDELVAVAVDESHELEEPARLIGTDPEPTLRVVLVIELARLQDVGGCVDAGGIIEPVSLAVLTGIAV